MTAETQRILEEARALPPDEVASLIDELLATFDAPNEAEQAAIDAAWVAECRDRLAAYDRGEVAAIPVEEVMAELDEMLDS